MVCLIFSLIKCPFIPVFDVSRNRSFPELDRNSREGFVSAILSYCKITLALASLSVHTNSCLHALYFTCLYSGC